MPENLKSQNTRSSLDAALKHIDINLIIAILKYCTDSTHSLNAAQLTLYMNSLTGKEYSERTIFRKLHHIHTLFNEANDEIKSAFALSHGGYIRIITSKGSSREQSRYYFEPLLSPADSAILQSAIHSNRYISPEEANYFSSILQLLFPTQLTSSANLTDCFPSVPKRSTNISHTLKYIDILGVVDTLHHAIQSKQQISLIYGHYFLSQTTFECIDFAPENPNDPYILNPYALFWHNSNYYLLATTRDSKIPVHFRVDRIVHAAIYKNKQNLPVTRDIIPDTLVKYFQKNGSHSDLFDSESYRSSHPQLTDNSAETYIDCVLECHADSLHLLIDTFGTTELLGRQIRIQKSDLTHTQHPKIPQLYENREPGTYFQVKIPNVERSNILAFCIQNHHLITPIAPIDLIVEAIVIIAASPNRHLDAINAHLEYAISKANPSQQDLKTNTDTDKSS